MDNPYIQLAYLASVCCFIVGLSKLGSARTARTGNQLASLAMLVAIIATLLASEIVSFGFIIAGLALGGLIGAFFAIKVEMVKLDVPGVGHRPIPAVHRVVPKVVSKVLLHAFTRYCHRPESDPSLPFASPEDRGAMDKIVVQSISKSPFR